MAQYIVECDYDGSGNLIYFGQAQEGSATSVANWKINKLTYDGSGNMLSMLDANGRNTFESIWDNRLGYAYS